MRPDNMPRPHAPEHSAMDVVDELGIAAMIHDDMANAPSAIGTSIRRGIAEIERLRAEVERLKADPVACLVQIRWAIGDNGKRMQSELVEYIAAAFQERDALRRRIEEAPVVDVHDSQHGAWIAAAAPDAWIGKRVRLVVEMKGDA
jgi:hypothetical protein